MNKVTVCSHAANEKSPAFNLLKANPNHWSVVFINNPQESLPSWIKSLSKDYLHLQFDDIIVDNKILKVPDINDVTEALKWTKSKDDVLFTCYTGISRSAAMAYICSCQEFYPEDSINMLKSGYHIPNQKIIQLGAEALRDKTILEVFKTWMDKDYEIDDIGIEYTKH